MKKRKKKGGGPTSSAPVGGDDVTSGPEEITEVNEAPIPGEARGDGVVGAVVEATVDVTIETAAETTLEIPTEMLTPPPDMPDPWDGPTAVGGLDEVAALAAQSARPDAAPPAAGEGEAPPVDSAARLQNIIESLIFASDKPLGLNELKRLVNERDAKKLTAALEAIKARHQEGGIQLLGVAGGWQFRTNPDNVAWVSKLMVGRPARLSRAMLETLAIVAYRQPITRPEIDEIRGVDCGPVLKTLLERGMIRMIGKKEEVGRPILYGTTPEFLRTFSLRDLTELPTLREFHELGAAEMAKVDAEAPPPAPGGGGAATPSAPTAMPPPTELPAADPDEEDTLLAELDAATAAAAHAAKTREAQPQGEGEGDPASAAPAAGSETPET